MKLLKYMHINVDADSDVWKILKLAITLLSSENKKLAVLVSKDRILLWQANHGLVRKIGRLGRKHTHNLG